MLLATIIFCIALAFVAAERLIQRTAAVLAGAGLMVATGILDQAQAFAAIDLATIGLLVGMMIVVNATSETGIFELIALRMVRLTRGHPIMLVVGLMLLTAVLSAFLDNLTAILIIVPIVIAIASKLGMRAVPLIIASIMASNIGGTSTLVGDPPNIMIGSATSLTFSDFLLHLAPISFLILFVVIALVVAIGHKSFAAADSNIVVDDLLPELALASGRELWIPVGVLFAAIVGFFLHSPLHVEPATVALLAAATLLVLRGMEAVESSLNAIDWTTMLFFVGLFVMVGGLEHAGGLEKLADGATRLLGEDRGTQMIGVVWISAVASALVDNIPFTAAMIPVVTDIGHGAHVEPQDAGLWWSLALGACLGGNFTVVGAAANVAAQGVAARNGIKLSFLEYLKWGVPVTFLALVMATGYVELRYA